MNDWAHRQIFAFKNNPNTGRIGALLDYALPAVSSCERYFTDGISVITSSWLAGGNATQVDPVINDYCKIGDVRFIVVGHQPHGDCPQIIRGADVTVVMADSSYSDGFGRRKAHATVNIIHPQRSMKAKHSEDPDYIHVKGAQAADGPEEVKASAHSEDPDYIHVKGVLANGWEHEYKLSAHATEDPDVAVIGKQLDSDKSWVKTRLTKPHIPPKPGAAQNEAAAQADGPGEGKYLAVLGKGFSLTPKFLSKEELGVFVDLPPVPGKCPCGNFLP